MEEEESELRPLVACFKIFLYPCREMVHAGQEFLRENDNRIGIKIDGSLVTLRVTDKVGSPWKVELVNENYTISIDFGNHLHYEKLNV